MRERSSADTRSLVLAAGVAVVALIATLVWGFRTLRRSPHPVGLTRVLVVTTVAGGLGAFAVALDSS